MVSRLFKDTDIENFAIIHRIYTRPHLEQAYCIQAWSTQLQKEMWGKSTRGYTNGYKGYKLPYKTRLKKLAICSLGRQTLRHDLVEAFKIFIGKANINCDKFSVLADAFSHSVDSGAILWNCSKPNNIQQLKKNLSPWTVNELNKLPRMVIDAPTVSSFISRLDKQWKLYTGVFSSLATQPFNLKYKYDCLLMWWTDTKDSSWSSADSHSTTSNTHPPSDGLCTTSLHSVLGVAEAKCILVTAVCVCK